MRYATPGALRQALEDRLAREARDQAIPLGRLRRRVAVERLLARLSAQEPGLWVVKGGVALEVRLGMRARTTRDLDMAARGNASSPTALQERLVTALAVDPDGDWFGFEVGAAKPLAETEAGRRAWRFGIRCTLDGREFASFHLDVVESDEVAPTEALDLPGTLEFAGVPIRQIDVVSVAQHFGEKLHALTRDYGGDRENTRVRDLVDLVAFIENGLAEAPALGAVARAVFEHRQTHPLPAVIPDPPSSWGASYSSSATVLNLRARTIPEGMTTVRQFWEKANKPEESET